MKFDNYLSSFFSDIDECLSNPCEHHATCHNIIASYECICDSEWTGDKCEIGNIHFFQSHWQCVIISFEQPLSWWIFNGILCRSIKAICSSTISDCIKKLKKIKLYTL